MDFVVQEVEEDKKKAAKLNALVQMVPSTDWPERKEPPEFSNPPRTSNKSKPAKEHHEHSQQYQPAGGEGRKVYTFAQVHKEIYIKRSRILIQLPFNLMKLPV